jgi:hypothetical protein
LLKKKRLSKEVVVTSNKKWTISKEVLSTIQGRGGGVIVDFRLRVVWVKIISRVAQKQIRKLN